MVDLMIKQYFRGKGLVIPTEAFKFEEFSSHGHDL